MKSLIIGMGIGQMYKSVLESNGHKVVTVDMDPARGADYTDLNAAIIENGRFDTAHIATPNFTHLNLARKVAEYVDIVFVDKPGVDKSGVWAQLCQDYPDTRFMMVKNNQWRSNIESLRNLAKMSRTVHINWINHDRVPNPGSWFTTKKLAYGGVSRDLMPHLLSLFMALEPKYELASEMSRDVMQHWQLADLTGTDYGTVKADGVYDVDDVCKLEFFINGRIWYLTADWRSMKSDRRNIEFTMPNDTAVSVELGLCPEDAYYAMFTHAMENLNNVNFWRDQLEQDLWIHRKIESL